MNQSSAKSASLLVRKSFAAAADRYDQVAAFQRVAADKLFAGTEWLAVSPSSRLLDLGCGTGYGMRLMQQRWPEACLITADFALPMLEHLPAGSLSVCADAHALPLATGSIDGLFSNLVLQWCDVQAFAAEVARVLAAQGKAAISTLAPGTFAEMRAAFAGVDSYAHTLTFLAPETMAHAFLAQGLDVRLERETLRCHFADLPALLASVRDLGANRLPAADAGGKRHGLMGKITWQRFVAAYEAQREQDGLPLSYDTVFLHISKPA